MSIDVSKASTPLLLKLLQTIREAVEHDRSRKDGDVYYGVDEFADIREQAGAIETELMRRKAEFDQIKW